MNLLLKMTMILIIHHSSLNLLKLDLDLDIDGKVIVATTHVKWLDPEPDRENSDYDEYIEELEQINSEVYMFRGFHQPPTEEEYHRLWGEYNIDD